MDLGEDEIETHYLDANSFEGSMDGDEIPADYNTPGSNETDSEFDESDPWDPDDWYTSRSFTNLPDLKAPPSINEKFEKDYGEVTTYLNEDGKLEWLNANSPYNASWMHKISRYNYSETTIPKDVIKKGSNYHFNPDFVPDKKHKKLYPRYFIPYEQDENIDKHLLRPYFYPYKFGKDNIGYVLRSPDKPYLVAIDVGDFDASYKVISKLEKKFNSQLRYIFTTHYHPDNSGGNLEWLALKKKLGQKFDIIAAINNFERIPGVTEMMYTYGFKTIGKL